MRINMCANLKYMVGANFFLKKVSGLDNRAKLYRKLYFLYTTMLNF